MGLISQFLNEKLQAKEAELLIDETMARAKQRTGIIYELLPVATYDNDEFLMYVTETLSPAASIIAPGAEVPTSSYGYFRKVVGQLAKFGLSYAFDEDLQTEIRKARESAMYKGTQVQNMIMPDGTVVKGSNDTLVNYLYGSITKLVEAHINRMIFLGWQALQYGEINFQDPLSRMELNISYKRPGATYNHFPDALVQTGDTLDKSLNKWSDYEYADGLTRLFRDVLTWNDTNGYFPDKIYMDWELCYDLMQQKSTKEAARSMMVSPQVGSVSVDMLNVILAARKLPPIECTGLSETFQEHSFDGTVTNTGDPNVKNVRFFDKTRYIFGKKGMGQLAFGETEEAKMAAAAKSSGMPGETNLGGNSSIYVCVKADPTTPLKDYTIAVAKGLPVIPNPKLLFSRKAN